MSGLTRVRQFAQDDAHCFVAEDQIGTEVTQLLKLIGGVYKDFNLTYTMELSTRPDDHLGESTTWDHAEEQLKIALESTKQAFEISEGEGNFYGPKIDFHVTDAIGRKWQCATIQLDYQLPKRVEWKYIGADNGEHTPVVIHRAIFGSFERFIALLIEHYAGAFPLWLSPVQVIILPIADRHTPHAEKVLKHLSNAGLRAELDSRQEKIGYKIREAQLQKIPYMLVVGDREIESNSVAVRKRTAGDIGGQSIESFTQAALEEVQCKGTVTD